MRSLPPQIAVMASAGILCAGVAWAGNLFLSQPEYKGTDPRQIRELAQRIERESAEGAPLLAPDPGATRRITAKQVRQPAAEPRLARAASSASVRRQQASAGNSAPAPTPSTAPAPEDPVKNLALFGVTREGETDQAWLVDLTNQAREVVPAGGTAFGFTVRKIGAESVTLARGNDEYQLRLGEKQLPTTYATASSSDSGSDGEGGFGPFGGDRGDRGERGRDGFRGFPGGFPGGGDFASRMAEFRSRFGSSGRSWGGDRGGDSGSSYRGSYSSSSDRGGDRGDDRSRDSSRYSGSRFGSSRFGSSYGGFGGFGGFGGYGGYGGSSRSSSQFGSMGATATSNPQTARRRGTRLTSGSQAQETPQPISNPQTTRRSGNSSGLAFGQEDTSRGRNSSSNSRFQSYGR